MATIPSAITEDSVLMTFDPAIALGQVEITGPEVEMGRAKAACGLTDLTMVVQLYAVSGLQVEFAVLELNQARTSGQFHPVVDESTAIAEGQGVLAPPIGLPVEALGGAKEGGVDEGDITHVVCARTEVVLEFDMIAEDHVLGLIGAHGRKRQTLGPLSINHLALIHGAIKVQSAKLVHPHGEGLVRVPPESAIVVEDVPDGESERSAGYTDLSPRQAKAVGSGHIRVYVEGIVIAGNTISDQVIGG